MSPVSRRRQARRGSTMLELSFIFLVFFSLLMGAFDFGQFLFLHQALVERARYAARWGMATYPQPTNAEIRNMVIYGQSTAGTNGYFGLSNSTVTVTQSNANTYNWCISVLISNYRYNMFSPYLAGSYTSPNINVTIPLGRYD